MPSRKSAIVLPILKRADLAAKAKYQVLNAKYWIKSEPDLRGEPAVQEHILRYAQDFGSRLRRLLNASSLERNDTKKKACLRRPSRVEG
jgi:hypothetical protein